MMDRYLESLFEWGLEEDDEERTLKALPYVIDWFERTRVAIADDESMASKNGSCLQSFSSQRLCHFCLCQPHIVMGMIRSGRGNWWINDTLGRLDRLQTPNTSGHCGQGLLSIRSGDINSNLVTDLQRWRMDVPIQSVPVSPPPMTITSFPAAVMNFSLSQLDSNFPSFVKRSFF